MTVAERDGRHRRGERSRETVAGAVLALLDEGHLRPTRQQIADRAGVSLRLVHHHFREREQLFAAAARLQSQRISRHIRPLPVRAGFERRLAAFAARRAAVLEAITPVRRAAQAEEPFSHVLGDTLAAWRRLKREQVVELFAPELRRRRGRARRELAAAACCAASWSAWYELRHHQDLSVDEARAVLVRQLRVLLGPRKGTS